MEYPSTNNMQAPAPLPPWLRPVVSSDINIITGNDTINLGCDTTYLEQATPNAGGVPYVVVLPNGIFLRQIIRIYIPGNFVTGGTASFKVTGTLVGTNSLVFNSAATSAVLEWDATGWQLIGGNAQPSAS